jgi:FkbM family methyltransferase
VRWCVDMISRTIRRGRKALRLLRNSDFRRGLFQGVGASLEHERVLARLDVRTVVDVGANLGQFSLLALSLYPQAKIFAFEPQAKPAAAFTRLFAGVERVTLFSSAIGTRSGDISMHVSRQHDSSSLLPISNAMGRIFPGTEEVGCAKVSIAPLAHFLRLDDIVAPALLKIDVQGTELDVLQGSEVLLGLFQYIYVELSFVELYTGQALCHQVIGYLNEKNLRLVGVHNLCEDASGQAIQADFLFRRDRAAS